MTKSIFEKMGLVESDLPEHEEIAPTTPVVSMPAPAFSQHETINTLVPTTLSPEDQASMKAIEAEVYATPSSYVVFQRVRASMGNTADLRNVFNVLTAANPGVTPAKVMSDLETHLGIIASKKSEFDAKLAQARASRVDGPNAQIADLSHQNIEAQQQIIDRTSKIAQIQRDAQAAAQSLLDGAARFKAIENQLSAPLLQTKQLLGSIT